VTSSVDVFEAAIWAKWMYMWQNHDWKAEKRENMEIKCNFFYIYLHLTDDLGMEFTAW